MSVPRECATVIVKNVRQWLPRHALPNGMNFFKFLMQLCSNACNACLYCSHYCFMIRHFSHQVMLLCLKVIQNTAKNLGATLCPPPPAVEVHPETPLSALFEGTQRSPFHALMCCSPWQIDGLEWHIAQLAGRHAAAEDAHRQRSAQLAKVSMAALSFLSHHPTSPCPILNTLKGRPSDSVMSQRLGSSQQSGLLLSARPTPSSLLANDAFIYSPLLWFRCPRGSRAERTERTIRP